LLRREEAVKQFLAEIEKRFEAAGNLVNSQSRRYWRGGLMSNEMALPLLTEMKRSL
jgi:hypothetical protein